MVENFHKLSDSDKFVRLNALKSLAAAVKSGELKSDENKGGISHHIYTTYSFSPYTPSKAAFMGYMSGLETIGIIDRDSVSGAKEFLAACDMLGIAATFGAESLVKFDSTLLKDAQLNCEEQPSLGFCVLHGIPHQSIDRFTGYFEYYAEKRTERLKKMAEKYNELLTEYGLTLDFEKDVSSLATVSDGGVLTEEHLLLAVANKILERYDKGNDTIEFLLGELELELTDDRKKYLKDTFNPGYELDMVDVLRQDLLPMWIDADEECPDVKEFVKIAKETGAILAYSYTGTEDVSAEELLSVLKGLGFNGITYQPSKLSSEQLEEIKKLCVRYDLMQISGEYVNRPRQSFVQENISEDLKDTSWAIIGHEKAASVNEEFGMFSKKIIGKFPTLKERIDYFSSLAKKCQAAK
ncbi:MAG: PHP domain-containing protein [Ruminococcaceae bacterium]|nr:PHP domain-containing protein [Oscillospiraceae bacterium]